jgi:predicted dehydrogenase
MEFPFGMTEDEARTWRCADPLELGGPIGDVGSHCFYMAEFLLGCKITGVRCVYTPKRMNFAVEDGAYIKFSTVKGIDGLARVAFDQKRGSLDGTLKNLGYEIYGSNGFIEGRGVMFQLSGHDDEPVKLSLSTCVDGVSKEHRPDETPNIYASQISEHARSILDNKRLSGKDALRNLQLVLLSHESAVEGGVEKRL